MSEKFDRFETTDLDNVNNPDIVSEVSSMIQEWELWENVSNFLSGRIDKSSPYVNWIRSEISKLKDEISKLV